MTFKDDWDETKQRFEGWWKGEAIGRPLMHVVGRKERPGEPLEDLPPKQKEFDAGRIVADFKNYFKSHVFLDAAFPSVSADLGPGSMALYLGCEPEFMNDTVWFKECAQNGWDAYGPLVYDGNNRWWVKHLEMIAEVRELAGRDFLINIPDIMENLDILASMRGALNLCYDLIDDAEAIHGMLGKMESLYYKYYDAMYGVVKGEDGSSSYTAFRIWGPGKTVKLQCDYSSVMSPGQFAEFAAPYIERIARGMDRSLYHLDGEDAVKHLDAVLKIGAIDAVQWEPGDFNPDAGDERWYGIYDKVRSSGKGLWLAFRDGRPDDWLERADKIVKRYGAAGLYFIFPVMPEKTADGLLAGAEKLWG